jgi:hypothetical protein
MCECRLESDRSEVRLHSTANFCRVLKAIRADLLVDTLFALASATHGVRRTERASGKPTALW